MSPFVPILQPNNRPDANGRGCVPYAYDVARFQVTNEEWCAFLNTVGVERSIELGLYHKDMATGILGGIEKVNNGLSGFACKTGWERKPVVYVTYTGICRYCNWLMTGDLEKGCYDLSGKVPRRLVGAKYFLLTDDEWYKAAYYDPATHGYHSYPTGDALPRLDQANYERGDEFSPIALTPILRKEGGGVVVGESCSCRVDGANLLHAETQRRRAVEKVESWLAGVDEVTFAAALEKLVEEKSAAGEYRFKKEEEQGLAIEGAKRFFAEFSRKIVPLSDGRCVYFAPDARAKARNGSNVVSWAEYAFHAVSSSGKLLDGKNFRERLYNATKAKDMPFIEEIIMAEHCMFRLIEAYRER